MERIVRHERTQPLRGIGETPIPAILMMLDGGIANAICLTGRKTNTPKVRMTGRGRDNVLEGTGKVGNR